MIATNIAEAAVSMAEAQAYARVETGEEEALLAGLVRTATALCECFTGQLLISRDFALALPATASWQKVGPAPVRSIAQIEMIAPNGSSAGRCCSRTIARRSKSSTIPFGRPRFRSRLRLRKFSNVREGSFEPWVTDCPKKPSKSGR